MHFMFNKYLILLLICFEVVGCKKDKKEYDVVPLIESVSINPTTVIQNKDSVTFVIKYIDGDGDLGENSPNAKNLFLTDNRLQIPYTYRINQLAPSGSTIAIQGEVNVVLNNIALTDSSSQQSTSFSIYIKDRAGHQSNVILTGAITIKK